MAINVTVPNMGESVIEATVARWLKQEGDTVKAGEPLVELETDKINLEVGAQQAGVLQRIEKAPGDTVAVGDVLAIVQPAGAGEAGQPEAPAAGGPASPQPDQPAAQQPVAATSGKPAATGGQPAGIPYPSTDDSADGGEAQAGSERVTPLARRMAQELGVDLAQVKASGSGGRITKEDVQAFADQGAKPTPAATGQPAAATTGQPEAPARPTPTSTATGPISSAPAGAGDERPEERVRMTRRRQTIARRLVEAQHTAAMLTTFNEVDMSAVMDLRKRRREGFKERYGVDLGFMPFFIKAVVGALKAFPRVNSELQGEELILKHYYDIGIAVGAEEGLVVPVVRNADRLSFAETEKVIREYVTKSREGTLTLEDLRGGTFTITNGGVYGSLLSTPILNPPQVGILGMHAIKERPVVLNGEIVARPMMYVALSYDHRVVDGREAVQFLVRLKELVEDPEALLFS